MSQDARHHANLSVELAAAGLSARAMPYARAYLRQAPAHPKLETFTPYVVRAMGHIAHQQGKLTAALSWFAKAQTLFAQFGHAEQVARSSAQMAWVLARLHRPAEARLVLTPREAFPAELAYLHDSILAAILHEEGQDREAVEVGRQALRAHGRLAHDLANAAGVAIIVAQSLIRLGDRSAASALLIHAAELCALQRWDVVVRLLLNERAGGGELLHESAASSRGSADLRHRGCFSTGVA